MARVYTVEADGVSAYFDDTISIAFLTYTDIVTAETLYHVFDWLKALNRHTKDGNLRGLVYDFRATQRFDRSYLSTIQRQSIKTATGPIADYPIAMITGTMYQEKMIRMSQQLSPASQAAHTRILHSMQDALTYIEAWHNRREAWI